MHSENPKIALGTVQFGLDYGISNRGGKTSQDEVSNILDVAFNSGLGILDTAQAYGDSETVLGATHANRFKIITKINPTNVDKGTAEQFVQKSLQKLRIEKLYGMLFHSASSAIENPRIVFALREMQEKGIIQKLGFSVYSPHELEQCINQYGRPDIVQIPFSHLDQRFEELARELHQNGVEVHTRSTFLQGLFFKPLEGLPEFFGPVVPYLKALKSIFLDEDQMAQALLSFCLSKDFIDYVVLGVNNVKQLEENLKATESFSGDLPNPPNNIPENIVLPYLWPK
ncbi:aldo/keto reductase [Schleiferiaceae bacterium]|nr:aldo/keto reductase [Schleiferiaceae bacterium]